MIESNLAKESEYEWIIAMSKNGYEITLYFLCTDYVEEIHVARVQKRVKEGGHFVPPNIVEHRYRMGLIYLRSKLSLFKEVYLVDNAENASVKAVVTKGIIQTKSSDCPAWIKQVLFIAERLQSKGK